MVKFDLETFEPVLNSGNIHPSDIVDEIPFPYSPRESDPISSRRHINTKWLAVTILMKHILQTVSRTVIGRRYVTM